MTNPIRPRYREQQNAAVGAAANEQNVFVNPYHVAHHKEVVLENGSKIYVYVSLDIKGFDQQLGMREAAAKEIYDFIGRHLYLKNYQP